MIITYVCTCYVHSYFPDCEVQIFHHNSKLVCLFQIIHYSTTQFQVYTYTIVAMYRTVVDNCKTRRSSSVTKLSVAMRLYDIAVKVVMVAVTWRLEFLPLPLLTYMVKCHSQTSSRSWSGQDFQVVQADPPSVVIRPVRHLRGGGTGLDHNQHSLNQAP